MADVWEDIQRFARAIGEGKAAWVLKTAPDVLAACDDDDARATLLGCLATAAQSEKDCDASIRYATDALKLNPTLWHVWANRSLSLLRKGRVRLALADVNRLLDKNPSYALGFYVRSVCYLVLASESDPALKPIMLRRALADSDESLHYEPDDAAYAQQRELLRGLVGEKVVAAEQSIDGWAIAEKLAKVAGRFVGGMIG